MPIYGEEEGGLGGVQKEPAADWCQYTLVRWIGVK